MEQKQIKFRIWNGTKMEYNVIAGKFGAFYVNPENDGINPNDTACLTIFNTKYWENTPVMQWTGLKDKNGVDIYEDDIIVSGNGIIEIINFGEWHFELSIETTTEIISGFGFSFSGREPFGKCAFGDGVQYEVIGNIFKNPDLLKSVGKKYLKMGSAEQV